LCRSTFRVGLLIVGLATGSNAGDTAGAATPAAAALGRSRRLKTWANALSLKHQNALSLKHQNALSLKHQNALSLKHQNALSLKHQNALSLKHQNALSLKHQNVLSLKHQNDLSLFLPQSGAVPVITVLGQYEHQGRYQN
jgi:hypothetical protein